MTDAVRMQDETPLEFDKSDLLRERRVVSEFAPKRQSYHGVGIKTVESLDEIEDTIAQHRRATEESTKRLADVPITGAIKAWDPLDEIARMVAALPLRIAMEQAEAVVSLPDYKPPTTKIELAMLLNAWAEARLEPPPK